MKKNAFTLVELIAVIVLLAIVMMLVVPSVANLKKQNEKKQYETYEDMMIEYSKTMTIKNSYVCLAELKMKPIADNITCNGYVNITTSNRKAFLRCVNIDGIEIYKSSGYTLPSACN